ncbi:MAG: ribosome recycling factor [Patescibacteria group bacterium]
MESSTILAKFQADLSQAKEHFVSETNKLRTGRAHPSMLDGVMVEAYETMMPLNQVASISIPENTTIQVSPFDANNIEAITAAIAKDEQLGFNPVDDGRVVRVPVPALTTERRQQIVKTLGEKKEEAFISMRNARHDCLKALKESDANQDEVKRAESQVEDLMTQTKTAIESLAKEKESEILTV